jgi:hypothetical protein
MTEWLDVSDTTPRTADVATAGQTVFTVPFVFFDEADLVVTVNDATKTLTTHYTTSGAGEDTGGYVTLVTGATAGDAVVITRTLAYELTSHIPPSGPLDIPAVNLQFSKIVAMLQQAVADWPRSLRQPSSDVDDLDALPVAASRASKYLAFDADGQPSLVAAVSTSAAATAFMLTLLDDTTAAAARATLGITDQSAYTGAINHLHYR